MVCDRIAPVNIYVVAYPETIGARVAWSWKRRDAYDYATELFKYKSTTHKKIRTIELENYKKYQREMHLNTIAEWMHANPQYHDLIRNLNQL